MEPGIRILSNGQQVPNGKNVAHRQFNLAKAMYYNGLLDDLPELPQWREAYTWDEQRVADAVKHFEPNLYRAFRAIHLEVYINDRAVCFNCLRPFGGNTRRMRRTSHHVLPWRFRGLPEYSIVVPLVAAHEKCTCRWHMGYDDFRPALKDASIWNVDEYIAVAQQVQFGFGLFTRDQALRHHPTMMVSRGLLPFILGFAEMSYEPPAHPSQLIYLSDKQEIVDILGLQSLIYLSCQPTRQPEYAGFIAAD